MADKQYVSHFDLPSFIMILGFSIPGDILGLLTFGIGGIVFSLILRFSFALMGVKNAAVNKVFLWVSPTLYTIVVYVVEKGKENSPTLAKADAAASGAGLPIPKA